MKIKKTFFTYQIGKMKEFENALIWQSYGKFSHDGNK